jgi:ATP-dependent Zn protease
MLTENKIALANRHRNRTAWHESGHALTAVLWFGGVVKYATIKPEAGQSLRGFSGIQAGHVEYLDTVKVNLNTIGGWAAIYMAGRAAEILGGVEDPESDRSEENDKDQVRDDAVRIGLGLDPAHGERLILKGRSAATALLARKRKALEAIANKLLARETLTGNEILAIVHGDL